MPTSNRRTQPLTSFLAEPTITRRRCNPCNPFPYRPGETDVAPAIWLDLLPSEVCERIATELSAGPGSIDALHLAQTSLVQSRAVATSLLHSLCIHSFSAHESEWMSILKQDVQKLTISSDFWRLPLPVRSDAALLLSAPTLRSAYIPDHRELLHAIANASSLQELTVLFSAEAPVWPDSIWLLMRSLRAIRLRRLELHCRGSGGPECPVRRLERLQVTPIALDRCCPHLTLFDAPVCFHDDKPFWRIWTTLPRISDVVISRHPPEWVIPRLKTVPSVRVKDMHGALRFAIRLGAAVTHLEALTHRAKTAAEIAGLAECKNMAHMELYLEDGEERSLQQAVRAMPRLESLTARWESKDPPRVVKTFVSSDGRQNCVNIPRYSKVTDGAMLDLVHEASALAHLDLLNVRIRVSEVVAILKRIGTRLRHFGVALIGQYESSVERFETLVETIIEHNRELDTVAAGDAPMPSCHGIDMLLKNACLTERQSQLLKYRRKLVRTLVRRVSKYVPRLGVKDLQTWIDAVHWMEGC